VFWVIYAQAQKPVAETDPFWQTRLYQLYKEETDLLEEGAQGVFLASRLSGPGEVMAMMAHLARRIKQELAGSLHCAAGSSKLVAQVALSYARRPFPVVALGEEANFLAPLPVEALSCLPPGVCRELRCLGLRTVADIQQIPPLELRRQLGAVGEAVALAAQGKDCDPVRAAGLKAAVRCTVVLPAELPGRHDLIRPYLPDLAQRLATALQTAGLVGTAFYLEVPATVPGSCPARSELRPAQASARANEIKGFLVHLLHRLPPVRTMTSLTAGCHQVRRPQFRHADLFQARLMDNDRLAVALWAGQGNVRQGKELRLPRRELVLAAWQGRVR
jgi:nucleotidyltransferase/DNA polymerase involved in DNA repair